MIVLYVNAPGAAEFVRARIEKVMCWLDPHKSIAAFEGDRMLGAVVYDGFTPYDCNLHIALDDRRCVTPRTLRAVFAYPFEQLKLPRVTAQVGAGNVRSLNLVRKLGFVQEGVKRRGLGDEDELIFGLLRTECRWLA